MLILHYFFQNVTSTSNSFWDLFYNFYTFFMDFSALELSFQKFSKSKKMQKNAGHRIGDAPLIKFF